MALLLTNPTDEAVVISNGWRRLVGHVPDLHKTNSDDPINPFVEVTNYTCDGKITSDLAFTPCEVFSSLCSDGYHRLALDIDGPMGPIEDIAKYFETERIQENIRYWRSSTPGNYHLIASTPMTWDTYQTLLINEIGYLQQGYVNASIERQATTLRLPSIKKSICERH
jgi:hypothetical protein